MDTKRAGWLEVLPAEDCIKHFLEKGYGVLKFLFGTPFDPGVMSNLSPLMASWNSKLLPVTMSFSLDETELEGCRLGLLLTRNQRLLVLQS
jgi:hypothetical protein